MRVNLIAAAEEPAVIRTFDHWVVELHSDQEYPGTCRSRLPLRRILRPDDLNAHERAELYEIVLPTIEEALLAVLTWSRSVYERWVREDDNGSMLLIPLARHAKVPVLDRPIAPSEAERHALVHRLRTHLRSCPPPLS
ncbi:hypothetical protein EDM68_03555 [Candidatus Uhrbacteria bacterium]|jgi:hypothetical protein|nr:MAG: hypothetical protein EDM68_03555 [Candidatus Uhrbacteria bacterium]